MIAHRLLGCFFMFLESLHLSGVSSVPFLDLSLVNDTVERGGIFEVQANHFSPNLTSNSFLGIACGYLSDPVTYAPLTRWFGGNFNSMTPIQSLPSAYQERVKVRERTIMRIENTRFTDEGTTFFCTLSFLNQSVLAEIHKTVKLKSVYAKPERSDPALPSSIEMLEKQLVSLTCNFTGRPKVNVTWSYGNQINGTSTLVYDDSSSLIWVASSLNITFVPKICKNYTITCTGENQFGTAEQSTVLKVTVAPEITNASINYTVIEGERLVLSCNASGCPAPEITWRKIGSPVFHRTGESVTFEGVVLSDHGEYICSATDKGQTATKMGMLTVHYKPTSIKLTSNATDVNKVPVNSTLLFNCSSNARPTASYRFYRNGNMEQNSSSNTWKTPMLTCPATSAGENFTCVAYNTVGDTSKTLSIMLFETPKITKRPQSSLTRNVSESIVLTCDASGCPKPEITWKRVGSNSVSHGRSSYHIPSISRSDDGSYVCFATTGGVTVNATTELKVQYPPTLNKTLPQNETLCLHKNVTLQCTASSGFPAPWLTLYNGSRILAKTNLSKLSHPITVSSAGDFKQYHCKASNLVGFDTVNISVNPAVRPTPPTDVLLKVEETINLRITWEKPQCEGEHGIEGYFIYYKVKGKGYIKTPPLKCCDHKIQNLQEGTDYDVYVVAVDSKRTEGTPSKIESVKMGVKKNLEPKPDSMGAIIGGAAGGGVLVLIVIIVIAVVFIRWRKNKHQVDDSEKGREGCLHRPVPMQPLRESDSEHNLAPNGKSAHATVVKSESSKDDNNVHYIAPDGKTAYASVVKKNSMNKDNDVHKSNTANGARDYEIVQKKEMNRDYDTVGSTIKKKEENNYADLGSFGDKVPTPAANKKQIGNLNKSEYSAIENLGPLRIHQENSTSDKHLYDNL